MIIFGCKIVHVLCFAVTQLNLAYIVKIRRKGQLFNDELLLITYLKGKHNSK